jgi:hypothetical protein
MLVLSSLQQHVLASVPEACFFYQIHVSDAAGALHMYRNTGLGNQFHRDAYDT